MPTQFAALAVQRRSHFPLLPSRTTRRPTGLQDLSRRPVQALFSVARLVDLDHIEPLCPLPIGPLTLRSQATAQNSAWGREIGQVDPPWNTTAPPWQVSTRPLPSPAFHQGSIDCVHDTRKSYHFSGNGSLTSNRLPRHPCQTYAFPRVGAFPSLAEPLFSNSASVLSSHPSWSPPAPPRGETAIDIRDRYRPNASLFSP